MNTQIRHSSSLPRLAWLVGLMRRMPAMVLRRRDHWRRSPAARDRTLPPAQRLGPAGPNGDPGRFRGDVDQWADAELPRLYFELPFVGMAISSATSRRLLRTNSEFCRMMGYKREELEGKTWPEITYPDDLDANVEQFSAMLDGKIEGYRLRKRYIRADGSLLHAELEVRHVPSPDGGAGYTLATINDITERRLAELRLTARARPERDAVAGKLGRGACRGRAGPACRCLPHRGRERLFRLCARQVRRRGRRRSDAGGIPFVGRNGPHRSDRGAGRSLCHRNVERQRRGVARPHRRRRTRTLREQCADPWAALGRQRAAAARRCDRGISVPVRARTRFLRAGRTRHARRGLAEPVVRTRFARPCGASASRPCVPSTRPTCG